MSTREELLSEIDAFLRRHDMAPTRLGKEALRDPSFVMRLRDMRSDRGGPRSDTIDRIRQWMREYRPPVRPKHRLQGAAA
jgi:hypothetical protein